MPMFVEGFDRTLYLLDAFEIELSLEMNNNIERAMRPIQTKARGFMPSVVPPAIRNWEREPTGALPGHRGANVYRAFPIFDAAAMKAGIQYRPGLQKQTRRGFIRGYAVTNESAAGAIYETAGRKHPAGIPNKSRSGVRGENGQFYPNPGAGERFINALPPISRSARPIGSKGRSNKSANGRAIFKAWNEDQGNVVTAVAKAIEKATIGYNSKHTILRIPA